MASSTTSLMPAHRVIESTHSGVVTASDWRKTANEALALARETGIWRVLTNCSELTDAPTALEMLAGVEKAAELGLDADFRQALLWPEDAQARIEFDFLRTAEQNHGLRVKAFGDRDAAIAWLEEE